MSGVPEATAAFCLLRPSRLWGRDLPFTTGRGHVGVSVGKEMRRFTGELCRAAKQRQAGTRFGFSMAPAVPLIDLDTVFTPPFSVHSAPSVPLVDLGTVLTPPSSAP